MTPEPSCPSVGAKRPSSVLDDEEFEHRPLRLIKFGLDSINLGKDSDTDMDLDVDMDAGHGMGKMGEMSEEVEEEVQTQGEKKDKGKGRMKDLPDLPQEVWQNIFEHYYETVAHDWDITERLRGALTPLLVSRDQYAAAVPALYRHPLVSNDTTYLLYHHLASTPSHLCHIKDLTIRPSPSGSLTDTVPAAWSPLAWPWRIPTPASLRAYTSSSSTVPRSPLSALLSLLPTLSSLTIRDALIDRMGDAHSLFAALSITKPVKARLELRGWDLANSHVGNELLAATAPNVHARVVLNQAPGPRERAEIDYIISVRNGTAGQGNAPPPPAPAQPPPPPPPPPVLLPHFTPFGPAGVHMNLNPNPTPNGMAMANPHPGLFAFFQLPNANANPAIGAGAGTTAAQQAPPPRFFPVWSPESGWLEALRNGYLYQAPYAWLETATTESTPLNPKGFHNHHPSDEDGSIRPAPLGTSQPQNQVGLATLTEVVQALTGVQLPGVAHPVQPHSTYVSVTPLFTTVPLRGAPSHPTLPPSAWDPPVPPTPLAGATSIAFGQSTLASALSIPSSSVANANGSASNSNTSFVPQLLSQATSMLSENSLGSGGTLNVAANNMLATFAASVEQAGGLADLPNLPQSLINFLHDYQQSLSTAVVPTTLPYPLQTLPPLPPTTAAPTSPLNPLAIPFVPPTPSIRLPFRDPTAASAHEARRDLVRLIAHHWAPSLQALSLVARDPLSSIILRAPKLDLWTKLPVPHIRVHLPRGVDYLAPFKGGKDLLRDRIRRAWRKAGNQYLDEVREWTAYDDPWESLFGRGGSDWTTRSMTSTTTSGTATPLQTTYPWPGPHPHEYLGEDMARIIGGELVERGDRRANFTISSFDLGGGDLLLHPDTRLFEMEVNTLSEMADGMWYRCGTQLPAQACRILLGNRRWEDVPISGNSWDDQWGYMRESSSNLDARASGHLRRISTSTDEMDEKDAESIATDEFDSPTFSFQYDSADEMGEVEGEEEESGGGRDGDSTYDAEAAAEQLERLRVRKLSSAAEGSGRG